MTDKPDPDKVKDPSAKPRTGPSTKLRTGPGGLTMRELHEKVKQSHLRDEAAGKARNQLAQPRNRWQRFVRYVWDKKKG